MTDRIEVLVVCTHNAGRLEVLDEVRPIVEEIDRRAQALLAELLERPA